MRWIDSLMLASRSLRRRPVRALLTILAVALGTTLLVALGSVASTAGSRIVSKLNNGGPGTAIKVLASKADSDQAYTDDLRSSGPLAITDQTIATVRRSPYVGAVIPVVASRILAVPPPFGSAASTSHPEPAFNETMVGVDMRQASNLPITILTGRLPRGGSLTEVAVTESYLDHSGLSASSVIGTQVEIGPSCWPASAPSRWGSRRWASPTPCWRPSASAAVKSAC